MYMNVFDNIASAFCEQSVINMSCLVASSVPVHAVQLWDFSATIIMLACQRDATFDLGQFENDWAAPGICLQVELARHASYMPATDPTWEHLRICIATKTLVIYIVYLIEAGIQYTNRLANQNKRKTIAFS